MDYALYVLLAPLAMAVLVAVMGSIWRHREAQGAKMLLVAAFTIFIWLLFSTAELLCLTPQTKQLWSNLTYVPIAAAPLAWLLFALQFTGRVSWLRPRPLALLAVIPLLTAVFSLTNEFHGLLRQDISYYMVESGGLPLFPIDTFLARQSVHGEWFWVHAMYSYALVLISSILLLYQNIRSFQIYRIQSVWMVIGVMTPLVMNILYVFRLIPGLDKDFSAVSFAFGASLFGLVIRRYRALDLRPIARDVLVDRMHDGMVVLNRLDEIVDLNPAAASLMGLNLDTAVGKLIQEVLPLPALPTPLEESEAELNFAHEGRMRRYQMRVSGLQDRHGALTGRLLLLFDVTRRFEAEEALRRVNQELQQRNDDLDAFAHTVAHDLKNPVQGILGYANLLEDYGDPLPEEIRQEAIQSITQTALKMDQIIQELLLLSGVWKQEVELRPLSMGTPVQEALRPLRPLIEERGAEVVVPEVWPTVLGYAPWIEQVWVNLLSNAIKYGGVPPRVVLGVTPEAGGTVRFWVRDNGAGLAPHEQASLFTPFTRLERAEGEGHGLGLSIVRRIMEKLGGGCGVESTGVSGEGSTFYFTLPAAPPDAEPLAQPDLQSNSTVIA